MKNKIFEYLEQKDSEPLWRYVKLKRNGVSPLKENGQLHSDSRREAKNNKQQILLSLIYLGKHHKYT